MVDFNIKHVPGSSLMDADMLSRAPLDATDGGIDEDEEWKAFQINATEVVQRHASDKPFKVFSLGFGIGCDVMATTNTPFQIVGGVKSTRSSFHTSSSVLAPSATAPSKIWTSSWMTDYN